jgi:hypothetical protein
VFNLATTFGHHFSLSSIFMGTTFVEPAQPGQGFFGLRDVQFEQSTGSKDAEIKRRTDALGMAEIRLRAGSSTWIEESYTS